MADAEGISRFQGLVPNCVTCVSCYIRTAPNEGPRNGNAFVENDTDPSHRVQSLANAGL